MKERHEDISRAKEAWKEKVINPRLKKFKLSESPVRFYTPNDTGGLDFLKKVGFPGQYPFTSGNDPLPRWQALAKPAAKRSVRHEWGSSGAGKYGGFGTPEDYRDYLLRMHGLGRKGGPNMAFDLPTQCGYDSDSEWGEGEVGRVGVAVDTFRDFEVIYEAYTGDLDIDKVPSNFTINAPACVIIAMYVALAEKRGIPLEKLRGTPQNDILKEFVGRGTYIIPPRPSMRLFRDTLVFCTEHLPNFNVTSIGGYHMREAGATREQDLAFSMAIGEAYLQAGVDAGLDIDSFAPRFTFNGFGGSMQIYKEIAFQRAARRMWSTMLRERFGARDPRSMMIRQISTAHIGCSSTTLQRPLNNLTRTVVGGMAAGMSAGIPATFPPYDEPLGLGHSLEAQQLSHDATRILIYEAKIGEVADPWAGSYFMESLTDRIEAAAKREIDEIEKMGGAVEAIENGYMHQAVAKSAHEKQRRIEEQEDFVVGVNCFNGPHEIDVTTNRSVAEVYDAELMATAEERQGAALAQTKRERNNREVSRTLKALEAGSRNEDENLVPAVLECVKSYATLQEICDVLRGVFGEGQSGRA
ncbi:MAG: methylmalonyl-CoA mutase family protein [Desulfatiglans sp.]|jgi:methylmalonyl-CoA mutase N-terminal domain/subunit|nr:methylmalonyl-CoA mutase family protein [Thermodesulfobacteriota bacterium]MEE4353554.1 methylmalonyl-CoA mutase family protein [Desulfatiglans sp.]